MAAHDIKQTLTSAVDTLSHKPAHLTAMVDEIAKLEVSDAVAWHWWWLGIPNIDGFGIQVYVKAAQLAKLLPSIVGSKNFANLEVFPIGRPAAELFQVSAHLVPPTSGANIRIGGQR